MTMTTAADIITLLGMQPHPEGGHYVQTFQDSPHHGDRPASTAIYYLLQAGERSHWHRVDAAEIWHFHAGSPLALDLSADGATTEHLILGTDLAAGQRPQGVVPKGVWQAARSLGDWTLVGCTVAPGFRFEGFELAPPDWAPSLR
ncbi:cupin domain-containing protein [Labrys sp. LIt4]|uniref:cupin domain-containing protein n=1 Tax=Labrys sp. LIt4 TaxID=2821355 RepID=UPI001AE0CDD7|nr:cupin domain-containing protein [Labrys sp. LIt4]MBP0582261.1 cupin domain-containing protein [Labrys sp. LIt4]